MWQLSKDTILSFMKKADYYILSSIYLITDLRNAVLAILRNLKDVKALDDSCDIDVELLAKHCSAAHKKYYPKYWILFIFLLVGLVGFFVLADSSPWVFPIIALAASYIYLISSGFRWREYIAGKFTIGEIENWPVDKFDEDLVSQVNRYRCKSIRYFKDNSPFSKEGTNIGGWSVCIDTTVTTDPSLIPELFTEDQLYAHLKADILRLGFGGLDFKDLFYVDATEITKDSFFYQGDTLLTEPSEDILTHFKGSKSEKVRFYKSIKIKDWRDELVLTILFRVYKSSENLFLETKYFILPSLKELVRTVDEFDEDKGPLSDFRIIASNLILAPLLLLLSPLGILGELHLDRFLESIRELFQSKKYKDQLIGYSMNIEQLFRSDYYINYYQYVDQDFYIKTFEKRILNSIIDFLKSHHIDTSDLKESKTQILNNGIIMRGGEINAVNLAVGEKSNAKSLQLTNKSL